MRYLLKIGVFFVFYLIIATDLLPADTTTELSHKLTKIYLKRADPQTDTRELEQECLGLLSNVSSAEDSGLVYAEIAWIYSQSGLTNPKKTASYSEMALHYPLADTLTARMYVAWACAIEKIYGGASFDIANINFRIEIARICVDGLKQIMSYNLPETAPDISALPSTTLIDWGGSQDDPVYKEIMRENAEAIEKRKEVFRQRYLFRSRDALIDKLVYLGKVDSGTKKAIEKLVHDTLANADDVNEVLSLIEKKLSGD
jgi:hypothetical protein